jgi:isopentenyl diphosphate isomerase/L-lactate dehydrogenase-like FMN-dependent dehydrogenase
MVIGTDDEVTLRANREGFLKFQLRPRRLVDVSMIDTTVEIFGAKYDNPIVIAPTGSNRVFHPDGEVAVANAARAGNHLQILSGGATTSIEDAIAVRGAPCGSRSMPGSGESPRRLSDAQNEPDHRQSSLPSIAVRRRIGNVSLAAAHRYAAVR